MMQSVGGFLLFVGLAGGAIIIVIRAWRNKTARRRVLRNRIHVSTTGRANRD